MQQGVPGSKLKPIEVMGDSSSGRTRVPVPGHSPFRNAEWRSGAVRVTWASLSPGSPFFVSDCGRHLAMENLAIVLAGQPRFAAVVYYTGDHGERTDVLIGRKIYRLPPAPRPNLVLWWTDPVRGDHFLSPGMVRALPLVVSRTREWVRLQARRGWKLPRAVTLEGGLNPEAA